MYFGGKCRTKCNQGILYTKRQKSVCFRNAKVIVFELCATSYIVLGLCQSKRRSLRALDHCLPINGLLSDVIQTCLQWTCHILAGSQSDWMVPAFKSVVCHIRYILARCQVRQSMCVTCTGPQAVSAVTFTLVLSLFETPAEILALTTSVADVLKVIGPPVSSFRHSQVESTEVTRRILEPNY